MAQVYWSDDNHWDDVDDGFDNTEEGEEGEEGRSVGQCRRRRYLYIKKQKPGAWPTNQPSEWRRDKNGTRDKVIGDD